MPIRTGDRVLVDSASAFVSGYKQISGEVMGLSVRFPFHHSLFLVICYLSRGLNTMSSSEYLHPLDPATAEDIQIATDLFKNLFYGIPLHFKAAGLDEPPKQEMRSPRLFEGVIDVTNERVIQHEELSRDFHGPVDRVDLNEAAQVVMANADVHKELARLKIDKANVVLDPWDYGVDGIDTQERMTQVIIDRRLYMGHSLTHCRFSCT